MPVSGVVITCVDGSSRDVASRIAVLDGVEVRGVLPNGQIIAVLEADTVDGEVQIVTAFHAVDGVVAVRLAYHNFEDMEQAQP